jgi:hypothetical protein
MTQGFSGLNIKINLQDGLMGVKISNQFQKQKEGWKGEGWEKVFLVCLCLVKVNCNLKNSLQAAGEKYQLSK